MSDPRTHAELSVDVAYAHRKWKEAEAQLAKAKAELGILKNYAANYAAALETVAKLRAHLLQREAEAPNRHELEDLNAQLAEALRENSVLKGYWDQGRDQLAALAALAAIADALAEALESTHPYVNEYEVANVHRQIGCTSCAALAAYRAAREGK